MQRHLPITKVSHYQKRNDSVLKIPVEVSHMPLFEHTAGVCALSTPIAVSDHAVEYGHCFNEQSPPK